MMHSGSSTFFQYKSTSLADASGVWMKKSRKSLRLMNPLPALSSCGEPERKQRQFSTFRNILYKISVAFILAHLPSSMMLPQ